MLHFSKILSAKTSIVYFQYAWRTAQTVVVINSRELKLISKSVLWNGTFHPYTKFPITQIPIERIEICPEKFAEQQYRTFPIGFNPWFHPNETCKPCWSCLLCAYVSIPSHHSNPLHIHEICADVLGGKIVSLSR